MIDQSQTSVLKKIKELYPQLTHMQQQLASYILEHPQDVANSSISDLIRHTDLKSEASAVKFYRLLGYETFKSFKISLAQELAGRTFYHSQTDITLDDSPAEIRRAIFLGAANCLTQNAETETAECIEAAQLLANADRIIIIGQGASAAICSHAFFRFTEIGLNCIYDPDPHMNAAVLSHSKEKDLVLCVSQSGETADLYKQIELTYRRHVPTILITGNPSSSIARLSRVVLSTVSEERHILTDALNSRIAQFCLIDALFSIISISRARDMLPRLQETRDMFTTYKL